MLSNPKVKLEKMWDAGEKTGEVVGNTARFIGKNAITILTLIFVGMFMFIWAVGRSTVKSTFKIKDLDAQI